MNKSCIFMNTIMWIVSGLAITLGLYFTKNPGCLWAFFFPTAVTYLHITNISTKNTTNN